MKVSRVEWVRLVPCITWILAPSPTSWVALSKALTFTKPQFAHLQNGDNDIAYSMGLCIKFIKYDMNLGDKVMNKTHAGACVLTKNLTQREAEAHELLQSKWDNEQV